MASISDLQRWRDDLLKARLSGLREVRDQNGETVTYKSDKEMSAALAAVESEIQKQISASPNVIRFNTSKGI